MQNQMFFHITAKLHVNCGLKRLGRAFYHYFLRIPRYALICPYVKPSPLYELQALKNR